MSRSVQNVSVVLPIPRSQIASLPARSGEARTSAQAPSVTGVPSSSRSGPQTVALAATSAAVWAVRRNARGLRAACSDARAETSAASSGPRPLAR